MPAWRARRTRIKWVYYHNVVELGFDTGMSTRSSAYETSVWYKFWMTVLGNDTYNDADPPPGATEPDMETFVQRRLDQYDSRASRLEEAVRDMFEGRTEERRADFTGQGNLRDLNVDSDYWRMARQYYRLQEGIAQGAPANLETHVVVVEGQRPNQPSFIFQDDEIEAYFQSHELPEDVPEVTIDQVNP